MHCCRHRRSLIPTPAPRPGARLRRGRSKARAPVARKPCPLAPAGEAPSSPTVCSLLPPGEGARRADEGTSARTCRHWQGPGITIDQLHGTAEYNQISGARSPRQPSREPTWHKPSQPSLLLHLHSAGNQPQPSAHSHSA
ncbi:hypothetical protein XarjCFBP7645_11560 [Xanthomonas arboricola]|uniref:Uncharacterized protein n=1 Tax=Xanthomonas arboricola TaxID=56448 RepID=A0A2S7AEK4_9XANT|nr:hypothetical protein XarjCFBP7645_11560 [Xanthomonas arboricola]